MIDKINNIRNCTKCNEIKSFGAFSWDSRRNIPRSKCKKCTTEDMKKYYQEYKKRISSEEINRRARKNYFKKYFRNLEKEK